jgi:hypothetical protein
VERHERAQQRTVRTVLMGGRIARRRDASR